MTGINSDSESDISSVKSCDSPHHKESKRSSHAGQSDVSNRAVAHGNGIMTTPSDVQSKKGIRKSPEPDARYCPRCNRTPDEGQELCRFCIAEDQVEPDDIDKLLARPQSASTKSG